MNRHRRPAVDLENRININDLLNSERALKNIKGRATFEEPFLEQWSPLRGEEDKLLEAAPSRPKHAPSAL